MSCLYFHGNSSHSQMLGCVLQTATKTIVFDGGTWGDSEYLAQFIKDVAHSYVDGWFFTHPHHDHLAAFSEIRKNHPAIMINHVYSHFPPLAMLKEYGFRTEKEEQLWIDFENIEEEQRTKLHTGEVYRFDDVSVSVLRVFNPNITSNFVNNSSAVFRIDGPNKSVLLLGDLGIEGGNEVKNTVSVEELYADYTQLSHHGQNGVDFSFYQHICPKACLWAAPEWLYNNDLGKGFDTGPFNTVRTREWMDALGATEHIVSKDGTTRIPI